MMRSLPHSFGSYFTESSAAVPHQQCIAYVNGDGGIYKHFASVFLHPFFCVSNNKVGIYAAAAGGKETASRFQVVEGFHPGAIPSENDSPCPAQLLDAARITCLSSS